MEIEQFEKKEYWTVGVQFNNTTFNKVGEKRSISSHLTHINSQKMDQLSIRSDDEAREIEKMITASKFKVVATKTSKIVKNPPMPYITSTLQQDAANKLHFTASYTMKLAQKLYEGIRLPDGEAMGLITYMRTDGLHVSTEAAEEINSFVKERYGEKFASKIVRKHFKKVKNAQEAHEAIRPTYIRRLPEALADIIDDDSLKLYTLIWTRTMACQMEPATTDMVQVDIENMEGNITFRSVASKLRFPGFQEVYKDRKVDLVGSEDKEREVGEMSFTAVHSLKVSDSLSLENVCLQQHHTKPPPRYSEGALVKKMEELGIGRPSTYASTMKVLQDRNYVTIKSRALHPEFRGRMLSAFLSHHFSEVADYSFTADMENELDNVSAGETNWKGLIKDYWLRFSKSCGLVSNTEVRQVEGMLEKTFEHYLFSQVDNDTRVCPSCSVGTLRFKVSKFGSGYFIGCNEYPKCKYIAMNIHSEKDEYVTSDKPSFPPKFLGDSPNSNEKIFLKKGPYGYYVQLGEDRKGYKPERASIGEDADPENITLEIGVKLLSSKKVTKSGRSRRKPKTEKALQ